MRAHPGLLFLAIAAGCTDTGPAPNVFDAPVAMRDMYAAPPDLVAGVDSSVKLDGAVPADMGLVCAFTDGGSFPSFDKGCADSMSCSIGFHQTDCCGTLRAVGFNHAGRAAFDADEKQWENTCPKCNCPAGSTLADDGKPGTMQTITVSCDNGQCVTHGK